MKHKFSKEQSGQALVELAIVATTIVVFILGIVDYGRAIYDVQVMKNLAGEGSSIGSRSLTGAQTAQTTAQAVANDSGSDLNITSNGCVIETIVTNNSGTLAITDQGKVCNITASSKIGCLQGVSGCQSSTPTLPAYAATALSTEASGSSMAVTEIYYNFSTITPITRLLGANSIPSQFYTAAYY